MYHIIRLHKNGRVIELKAEHGMNLLEFLRNHSVEVESPCGGKGKCGKCRVIVKGLLENPSEKEKRLLGERAIMNGYRLACYNHISSDLEIFLDSGEKEAAIMTAMHERTVLLNPVVKKTHVKMDIPNIHDQLSDADRIMNALNMQGKISSLEIIRSLPDVTRQENFEATVACLDGEIIAIEPGNTTYSLYGIAMDIGTTTIASYLYDLVSGKRVDVHSVLNPQRKYGADVLSRIDYTLKSHDALVEVNKAIIDCINDTVEYFARRDGVDKNRIYACVFVGNTTMMHLLMGISPENIAISPFIPATTGSHIFKARELGIDINENGRAIVFPSVSGYIGADIVAGVLSSRMYMDDQVSLLIDIGTNGEMVLGNNKWLYACSTAAGPAFEGTNIRNGVGGVKGAIDRVWFKDDIEFSTIGHEKAIGICGSGIIDAIAGMLDKGVIDETGRIVDLEEANGLPEEYARRIIEIDGQRSLLLLKSEEGAAFMDIAITQKDVREMQNAKAAIAAGIKILMKQAGVSAEEVKKVYLAGGFGNYINVDSALKIGLIPDALRGRIESIGNSAGAGAVEGLLSRDSLDEAEKIRKKVKYIELSALPEFVDEYVENMFF